MKKLNKNTVLSLSLAAASTIAIGGTVAYNAFIHDDESAQNVVTVGEAVDIAINEYQREDNKANAEKLEPFDQGKKLYPYTDSAQGSKDKWGMPAVAENYGDKIVTVKNTGKVPAKVRVFIATPLALCENTTSTNMNDAVLHSNLGNRVDLEGDYDAAFGDDWKNNWDWSKAYPVPENLSFTATIDGVEYKVNAYTMNGLLEAGQESDAIISGVYLDSRVDYDDGVWTMGDYVIDYDFSKGVNIPVYAEAVAEDIDFEDAKTVFMNWAESVKAPTIVDSVDELSDAVAAGGEIILTEDLDLGNTQISIPAGVETILHLNGNDITAVSPADTTYGTFNIANGATLNIKGDGNVRLDAELSKGVSACIFQNDGTLNIYGGNYTADGTYSVDGIQAVIGIVDTCLNTGDAVTNIYGGTYSLTGEKAINLFRNWPIGANATTTLNVYDGTFKVNSDRENKTTYFWNKDDSTPTTLNSFMNFYGGTYEEGVVYEDYDGQDDIYVSDEAAAGGLKAYADNT